MDSTGNDVLELKNNWENLAEAVVRAVSQYIGKEYIPIDNSSVYVVKKGDSLWSISKKVGLTVNELKEKNNLTSNLLSIGQVLKIGDIEIISDKEVPLGSSIYTIVKGDTLYDIANNYNVSVSDLKNANNLTNNTLSIGQQLIIPSYPQEESGEIYIVKSGDSLYKIANKYNTSVEKIKKYNNLTSDLLSIGQQLTIPEEISDTTESEIVYIVKKGDSLYSISNKYDVSVDELKKANNLTSNLLSKDQTLVIPKTEEYMIYTVKKGDTLYSVAEDNSIPLEELKKANNISGSIISIGQKLIIPS